MEAIIVITNFKIFQACSRRVRRIFERAYLKQNRVPKVEFGSSKRNMTFKRLNFLTMIEELKAESPTLPKIDTKGYKA